MKFIKGFLICSRNNMQREFSLNIILLISVNLLIKPFFIFGIDRTVQNVVGTETYGVYATLLSFCYLLQIFNDFGIQNFNSREISQHRQMIRKYFPNILILKTGLAIIFLNVPISQVWDIIKRIVCSVRLISF